MAALAKYEYQPGRRIGAPLKAVPTGWSGTPPTMPRYANDNVRNWPWRRQPAARPNFGRRVVTGPGAALTGQGARYVASVVGNTVYRAALPIAAAYTLYELYELYNGVYRYRQPVIDPGGIGAGWFLHRGPCATNGPSNYVTYNQSVPATNPCLSGQAVGYPSPWAMPANVTRVTYWRGYQLPSPGTYRAAHVVTYARTAPQTGPLSNPFYTHGLTPEVGAPNPNVMRHVPLDPLGVPSPSTLPTIARPELVIVPQAIVVSASGQSVAGRASASSRPEYFPATSTRPPRRGDKEKKVVPRSASAGIAVFKALDRISEAAEVVDAVYQSLPADVRARWDAKMKADKRNPLVDRAGQYGIDHADYKLQAIYYNWSKIDATEAITNVLKNQIEDRLIGAAQRARERVRARNYARSLRGSQ